MAERKATADWNGGLKDGGGSMKLGSGAFEGKFSFQTRMEDEPGTNPEELIAAALAGCYSMALSASLEKEGFAAQSIHSQANVHFGKDDSGFAIRSIDLDTKAEVEGVSEGDFQRVALATKKGCPVSKALASVPINLTANLVKS